MSKSMRSVWNPYLSDSDPETEADSGSESDSVDAHASPGAGVVESLVTSDEAQDAAARFIADKMRLVRIAEPAIRFGLRSLPSVGPSSPYKDMAIEIFDEWAQLEKQNSQAKNPNLLHFTYMSLVMAQSQVLVLRQLMHKEGGGGTLASRALASVANQMQSRLLSA